MVDRKSSQTAHLEYCHFCFFLFFHRITNILWQNGALARLKKGETIDELLYNGYSTISLGYAGLCECTRYMTGKSHTDPEAKPFALKVMQHMNDACNKWRAESNIDFSLYGTPLESTTYKFARCLQERFGMIPRSEERRVGKECSEPCRSRWSPYH